MTFKIMVIDDAKEQREGSYHTVFSDTQFDPIFVWTRKEFEELRDTPVDGYIIDILLEQEDWGDTDAAALLNDYIKDAPRPAPIFLLSQHWGDDRVLDILKQASDSTLKIVQYLAWTEFQKATDGSDEEEARLLALRNKILSELRHWHGRSGFNPGPNELVRLLILSDVQFGDPSTDPNATFSEHWIARSLRREGHLPDILVIAGDLSHSARPDQFALAEERIALDLMGPLWGNNNIDRMRDRIVITPGNHDVNLRFSACDKYKYNLTNKSLEDETNSPLKVTGSNYLCHHDYALEPFRHFAHRLTKDRNLYDSNQLSWVDRRFIHCGFKFFIINTVAEQNAENPSHACFRESAIRQISRSLGDEELGSVFNIAISHHGLRPEGSSVDQTEVSNWRNAGRDFYAMHNIRLWIYGHYHNFESRSINSKPFDNTPLWLLQAPTSRISHSTRGFCVLDLHRSDGVVNDAFVHHYKLEHGTVEKGEQRRIFNRG